MALYVPENEPVYLTFTDAAGLNKQVRISRVRSGPRKGHLGIKAPPCVKIVSKRLADKRKNRLES
jgi:hypothetical protein